MKLADLPDCKIVHAALTIGKEYPILGTVGNGVVIQSDDPEMKIIILASRFDDAPETV